MIELRGVIQHYGVRPVLRDINLRIEPGGVTAIVGPNGMGKTTLLAVMAGGLSPQFGEVWIDGKRRRGNVEDELAIRRRAVYLPDKPWLPADQTGREFLLNVGCLYDIAHDRLFEHIERLLELFQLVKEGDWPIRGYSHGQKKKIALASVLITDCPLLLLDEPFGGGLDPAGIFALRHVLKRWGSRPKGQVVLTAPAPEMVEMLADRIIVLHDGRVIADDTLDGLRLLTSCDGTLTEVLSRLIHPDTLASVERYFEGTQP